MEGFYETEKIHPEALRGSARRTWAQPGVFCAKQTQFRRFWAGNRSRAGKQSQTKPILSGVARPRLGISDLGLRIVRPGESAVGNLQSEMARVGIDLRCGCRAATKVGGAA